MPSIDKRGSGFVHLNTPASISYTPGQALTLTELTRKRDRIECVTLPASIAIWRRAFHAYASLEGFQAMAADVEDERTHEGVILPPLTKKSAAVRTQASPFLAPLMTRTSENPTRTGEGKPVACSSTSSLNQGSIKTESAHEGHTMNPHLASIHSGFYTSHETDKNADSPGGIHIVSHHKVIGKSEFTYVDHDGILSNGVVPEVVITLEEKERKEAGKRYFISPQQMAFDELNAFEELQSLWKSKAHSHSVQGAMHRAAEEGSEVKPTTANDDVVKIKMNSHGSMKNYGQAVSTYHQVTSPSSSHADLDNIGERESLPDGVATEEALTDALRMVDDLLSFV
ncbi:unnamed protein product, partial [Phytomonas sp. Hart1]